jgi:hypothetical protein
VTNSLASGRLVLMIGTPVVVLAFIGAVYFQIYASSRATREGWILSKDVTAGTVLTAASVERAQVGAEGASFLLYQGDPVANGERATHAMRASHLLAPDDVSQSALALVPVSFSSAPDLHSGDLIDVYVSIDGQSTLVGRSVIVESPTSIWVAVPDEQYWVALEAGKAPMIAVRTAGGGPPASDSVGMQQALDALGASANGTGSHAQS